MRQHYNIGSKLDMDYHYAMSFMASDKKKKPKKRIFRSKGSKPVLTIDVLAYKDTSISKFKLNKYLRILEVELANPDSTIAADTIINKMQFLRKLRINDKKRTIEYTTSYSVLNIKGLE